MSAKWLSAAWASILSLFGCGGFTDIIDHGVPNLQQVAPGMWRMGQPADAAAWQWLATQVGEKGKSVLVVKLNDDNEGDDRPASAIPGWMVMRLPIPPEDDKAWTVLVKPSREDVAKIYESISQAHALGQVVVWHCTHGRDRTGLVTAVIRMKLFGWTKKRAWDEMIARGFRWELPDLDAYWIEDVR